MDICNLILNTLRKKGKIKTSEVIKQTGFSRTYINRFFQKLRDDGKIILLGKSNRAHYVLATKKAVLMAKRNVMNIHLILQNRNLLEDEVLENIRRRSGIFIDVQKNTYDIVSYAFTEMLNNAIEHSRSETIEIKIERNKENIIFHIIDKGVGIYNNIMQKKGFDNIIDAIQDLTKGKLSTVPKEHTGEGIFFTSKVADILIIQGTNKKLIFNNLLDDIFIKDIKNIKGTKITFSLNLNTDRILSSIFKQYTDNSFDFSKTKVTVRLYKMHAEYISRSQARRILCALDKFKTVILDFKGVETIGQGFADEIFRVWKSQHPNINIEIKNANENTLFMINRAIKRSKEI